MRPGKSGKIGLAELRKKLNLTDGPFRLNAAVVTRILEGPPVASLIPFGNGLYLQHNRLPRKGRAKANGRWYHRYHPVVGGKRTEHRFPLGNTDNLSPAQARDKNVEVYLKRRANIDIRAEREAEKQKRQEARKQSVTLASIWASEGKGAPPEGMSRRRWAISLQASWRKGGANHRKPIESYLDSIAAAQLSHHGFLRYIAHWLNDIEQTIGHIPIRELTVDDIARAVIPHWQSPYRGETLRWQIYDMIEYARTAKGVLIASNPADMPAASRIDGRRRTIGRDALTRLLGHREPHVKQHFPALPWKEDVPRFMARLRSTPQSPNWRRLHPGQPDRRILAAELCILMAGRDTAICTAKYSQIHHHIKGLEVRHELNKGGVVVQPLSERSWEIITACAAEDGIDLTAPESQRDVPVFYKTGWAAEGFGGGRHWDNYLKRVVEGASRPFPHFTLHGFRSCFADWAHSPEYRQDSEIVEMCLMHRTKTAVQAAYHRDMHYEEKRQVFEAWSKFCASAELPPDEVISMDKRRTKHFDDTGLVKELRVIMTSGKVRSLWAATSLVADRAAGGKGTTLLGKRHRLRLKYRETYGYDDGDKKKFSLLQDDLPLLDEMHCLLVNGEVGNLWAVTDKVADRAKGSGQRNNIRGRLYKHYEEVHGKAEKFLGYAEADRPLVDEIHRFLAEGKILTLSQAIWLVVPKAAGNQSADMKHQRLYHHYRDVHRDYQRFNGYAKDDAPLVEEMHRILSAGKAPSLWAATMMVVSRLKTTAIDLRSKRHRLCLRFKDTYGGKFNFEGHAAADAPLVDEMREIMLGQKAPSLWAASLMVADRASGDASLRSKRLRLVRYYNGAYAAAS